MATTSLPRSQGHVFYRKLNELLTEAGFDRSTEEVCAPYYHHNLGRPSIPAGVYFRMLLVGYFEGIGSQRGIAWRCADSLSLREFLGIPLTAETPDHSSLTRVRDRLPRSGYPGERSTITFQPGTGCVGMCPPYETPLGFMRFSRFSTQGSRCAATLGCLTEALRAKHHSAKCECTRAPYPLALYWHAGLAKGRMVIGAPCGSIG